MPVVRLNNTIINQIAAGEVVERPASVVRELLDNAIDADATRIDITIADGGKTLVKVTDNGKGMNSDDLTLAVERHCTSKLTDGLHNINTFGFRGEALPSIGSVARLRVCSRAKDASQGLEISIEGGEASQLKPSALNQGTMIEVRDLFYATPARLKFLKTERSESNAITDTLRRIALAHPHIHFTLQGAGNPIEYPSVSGEGMDAILKRIGQVLGQEFIKNAMIIEAEHGDITLSGYAALPTFHRGSTSHQFFYVNGRNVRDKELLGSTRTAYADSIVRTRHPVLVLFLTVDPTKVDVNVHPAKSEVRFYQSSDIRTLIVDTLKSAINLYSYKSSSEPSDSMIAAFTKPESVPERKHESSPQSKLEGKSNGTIESVTDSSPPQEFSTIEPSGVIEVTTSDNDESERRLGAARAQIHKNYIITQTRDGMIIVDQHAAHERIVYERIKDQWQKEGVASQVLLMPDTVDLNSSEVSALSEHLDILKKVGLELEEVTPTSVRVLATPALLGQVDSVLLLKDLVDDIAQWGQSSLLNDKIHYIAATLSCYGSVRSGRKLKGEEMNRLLRDMELTPNSGQCNHGRPTYIELKLRDIERLFGR